MMCGINYLEAQVLLIPVILIINSFEFWCEYHQW